MHLADPASVLLTKSDARTLAVLCATTRGLSGREVAQLTGMAHGSVWRSLRRFVEHGLVIEEEAGGRTLLYRLNREHVAADAVIALGHSRAELLDRIRMSIEAWRLPPVHAWVFGSMARGDGDTASDIDILVIRPEGAGEEDPDWRAQVQELASAVERWSGNDAGIADLPEAAISGLRADRPPVIEELLADAITLAGAPVATVFGSRD